MNNLTWHTKPPTEHVPHALLKLTLDGEFAPGRYSAVSHTWQHWTGSEYVVVWPVAWADLSTITRLSEKYAHRNLIMRIKHYLTLRSPATSRQIADALHENAQKISWKLDEHPDKFERAGKIHRGINLWRLVEQTPAGEANGEMEEAR
jgi:hypothetical protein